MDDVLEALDALEVGDSKESGFGGFSSGDDEEAEEEPRILKVPDVLPPAPAIPRVSLARIGVTEFQEKFLARRLPVVIEDHKGTCVPLHLDVAYFREAHGDKQVPLDFGGPSETMIDLSTYLKFKDPQLRRLYLRNLQMLQWFPEEASSLALPAIFGHNLLRDEFRVPGAPDTWRHWFELFICTRDCPGFPFLHQDMCHIHAVSLQVQGSKQFALFSPSDSAFLYPSGDTRMRSAIPNVYEVDLNKFPLFQKATPIHVQLGCGEMLFTPSDWWHTTRCVGIEPSVTLAASLVDEGIYEAFADAYCEFRAMQSLIKHGAGKILH